VRFFNNKVKLIIELKVERLKCSPHNLTGAIYTIDISRNSPAILSMADFLFHITYLYCEICICATFSHRRREDERAVQDDRDLVVAASAAAPTYPVARGVRNYRSNECVQRKYAPMATGVLYALCSFSLAAKHVCPPISAFVLCICTRELPARAIARGKIRTSACAYRRKIHLAANEPCDDTVW